MTGVASSRLLRGQVTTPGWQVGMTCPDGYTILLKTIFVQSPEEPTTLFLVDIGSPGFVSFLRLLSGSLTAEELKQLSVWIVLEPGDYIAVYGSTVGFKYWLSGSVLTGVNTAPIVLRMPTDPTPLPVSPTV